MGGGSISQDCEDGELQDRQDRATDGGKGMFLNPCKHDGEAGWLVVQLEETTAIHSLQS